MNKQELVKAVAEKANITNKDANNAINAFVETVTEELKNKGKISLLGFGTFLTSERAERQGLNPKTKEKITIPKMVVPRFKSSKTLKDQVR